MRYNQPHRPTISPDKLDKFLEYVVWVHDHSDDLKGDEITFVADMHEKAEQYGKRLFVSEAQFEWMERLSTRVG